MNEYKLNKQCPSANYRQASPNKNTLRTIIINTKKKILFSSLKNPKRHHLLYYILLIISAMKKLITLLCLGFILSIVTVVAQPYPDFNVTAYDSVQSNGYYFFCPYVLRAYPNLPSGTKRQMILDKKWKVVDRKSVV